MNRAQFMEQLKKLLADIPVDERDEALDYYESYFDDAGPENEAAVIRELGSPGKVAAIIKADLKESSEEYAQYTERGYEDTRTAGAAQMPEERRGAQRSSREQRRADRAERGYHAGKTKNSGKVALILILLVFLSPFLTGAVGGVLGVLVTILLFPFLLVFGAGVIALGLLIGALGMGVWGISLFATSAASAILTLGIACIMLAVGILLAAVLFWAAAKIFPKLLRKFTDFCYDLLHREKKVR